MSKNLILIVDDKFSVTRLVSEYLESKGYSTIQARDGKQALTEARIHQPDLILLDIMMPHMDGFEFINTFRQESNVPIILLTAKIEETDKIFGLGLGADDYVTKPFSMAELVARIEAVLRRTGKTNDPNQILDFDGLKIYPDRFEVQKNDEEINLTPTEFQLWKTMAESPGRVFTREQLIRKIQGDSSDILEKNN